MILVTFSVMKNLITFTLLFFTFTSFSQEKTINESDIIGCWEFDRLIKGVHYNISVYRRCDANNKNQVYLFEEEGKYTYTRVSIKCGNDSSPKIFNGVYTLNTVENVLEMKDSISKNIKYWKLLWVDKNTIGVK